MKSGYHILDGFRRKWQLLLWLEFMLYALGPGILLYSIFYNPLWAIIISVIIIGVLGFIFKPWKYNLNHVASYIDHHLEATEYSTSLILVSEKDLSNIARIQQHKITNQLILKLKSISPPTHILRGSIILGVFLLVSFLAYKFQFFETIPESQMHKEIPKTIVFTATDSTANNIVAPTLVDQQLIIDYPRYTQVKSVTTNNMNVKAIEGSKVSWKIKFDKEIKEVSLESLENSYPMKLSNGTYIGSSILSNTGYYNFKFIDLQNRSYISDLYAIEVSRDRTPDIEVLDIPQFTSFSFDQNKKLSFRTVISDDYGIKDAYIIATVSKGSGESVKFREERLNYTKKGTIGSRNWNLSNSIDLDQMQMEPGDELYFYIEAVDSKQPKSNTSRSETFFAVIKDTVSDSFAVEGTLGVDLIPDYFRSQRQLIIDTEKLIKEKSEFTIQEYKSKSNELGFDQKILRLRYAEFMGDESEIDGGEEETEIHEHEHEEEHEEEDPLEKYTHKHDTDNEHNLVAEETKKDPLKEYVHNHEDPEASTLFAQSLKSKLRQALDEMWDAELYLRLYTPEKSLPYQYKALKLIQEIKNSARIYVHRIGFDPPPIKEDKRLTGKIDEVSGFRKIASLASKDEYAAIREVIVRIQELVTEKTILTELDKVLFEKAGNELAIRTVDNPGKYLETLQRLKWISEDMDAPFEVLQEIQKGLLSALPATPPNPIKKGIQTSEMDALFLKELETYD